MSARIESWGKIFFEQAEHSEMGSFQYRSFKESSPHAFSGKPFSSLLVEARLKHLGMTTNARILSCLNERYWR